MIERLLVANRGEIARRIIRTCRRLGIATVAVHSDADADAPHVHDADSAVRIGAAPARDSYLDAGRIIEVARDTRCDAVHPGYGFLAENAGFARACAEADLIFVGPSPEVIALMGDKAAARRRMASSGIPVVPGEDRDGIADLGEAELAEVARTVGFPLLVKAVAGGGGKGMRTVAQPAELVEAVAAAAREAEAAFGDGRVLLERLVARPRHVEVQIFGDRFGSVIHLLERECSIQRRHQKIIEEAPSPAMTPELRERMCAAAVTAAAEVGYEGAGTVEFLVDDSTLRERRPAFWFLEMNTRLQVEHPVTEAVTGLDLVELQLRVAEGRPLDIAQGDIRPQGHAIEARVYAEDPVTHLPQTGRILAFETPDRVRVDSGVEVGSVVGPHYDPLLAKLIVHAPSRREACAQLAAVLHDTSVRGVVTNVALLAAVVDATAFRRGALTTTFLDEHLAGWTPPACDDATLRAAVSGLVAAARARASAAGDDRSPWARLGPLRPTGGGGWALRLETGSRRNRRTATIRTIDGVTTVQFDGGRPVPLQAPGRVSIETDAQSGTLAWAHGDSGTHRMVSLAPTRWADSSAPIGRTAFTAPMPGAVLALDVRAGEHVEAGTRLVVVEAMKMEHPVVAPSPGTVLAVEVAPGQSVRAGTTLLTFDPDGSDPDAADFDEGDQDAVADTRRGPHATA